MAGEQSLKSQTAKGLLWGSLGNGAQQLLNLFFGIFLARLLTPADYGMVGMLTIFTLIASSLQESGFISAIANRPEDSDDDYNSVFWFSVSVSFCVYWLLFFCAPLIARFYGEPALEPLSRFVFLGFFIASFGVAQSAYMYKHLMVKQRMLASTIGLAVAGAAGVALAWSGLAYWGLAVQSVAYVAVNTLCLWLMSPWRPRLRLSLRPIKEMLPYSVRLLVTNVFININNNFFSVVLGKFYGDRSVGYYNQASKWTSMGYTFVNGMVSQVSQPVLAQVASDVGRQRHVFRKMLRFTAFVSFPCMLGLLIVAPELITIAITDKWQASVGIMQLLCVYGAFFPIQSLYVNLMLSRGKSAVYMWYTIILGLLQLASALLLRGFGITAMVSAYVAINLLWLLVWQWQARREIGLTMLEAAKDVGPFLLLAAGVMALVWYCADGIASIWARLLLKIAMAASLYVGLLWQFKAKILLEAIDYIIKKEDEI